MPGRFHLKRPFKPLTFKPFVVYNAALAARAWGARAALITTQRLTDQSDHGQTQRSLVNNTP